MGAWWALRESGASQHVLQWEGGGAAVKKLEGSPLPVLVQACMGLGPHSFWPPASRPVG